MCRWQHKAKDKERQAKASVLTSYYVTICAGLREENRALRAHNGGLLIELDGLRASGRSGPAPLNDRDLRHQNTELRRQLEQQRRQLEAAKSQRAVDAGIIEQLKQGKSAAANEARQLYFKLLQLTEESHDSAAAERQDRHDLRDAVSARTAELEGRALRAEEELEGCRSELVEARAELDAVVLELDRHREEAVTSAQNASAQLAALQQEVRNPRDSVAH